MEEKVQLSAEKVQLFVAKAHGDFDTVKRLLAEEPSLVNASWDWGNGDWETGLGAAAHVGSRDIAEFLLAHGARLDIFAAAMLGKTAVVQAILADYPELIDAKGPHGIPLMIHAQAGGEAAEDVVRLLENFA